MLKQRPTVHPPSDQSLPKSVAAQAAELAFGLGDTQAAILACVVAEAHGVTVEELFHHSRSRAPIAATRQLAMYLMHVALGRSLTEVGVFFRRDRTTVSYACAQVEDERENASFDQEVDQLEAEIASALSPGAATSQISGAANDG